MNPVLHLVKLCVGADSIDDLEEWRREHYRPGEAVKVHTRNTPRRADELVQGGSLYWVMKGYILCRQWILSVDTVGEGLSKRCEIGLDPVLVATAPAPRRPFQGWRYFEAGDAPADLPTDADGQSLPPELARQLRVLGAW